MVCYLVRFSSVADAEDFACQNLLNLRWLNDTDEFNRALIYAKTDLDDLFEKEACVLQFNIFRERLC